MNRLVGEKVSIVSPVEQTTRNTIRGIVEDARGQLVLLDTPGLHKAVGTLGTLLNRMARRSAAGADITCVVYDASQEPQLEDVGWMQRIAREGTQNVLFVLNKADKKPFFRSMFEDAWKESLSLRTVDADQSESTQSSPVWVECSALDDAGAKPVLDALFEMAGEGEPLFPEDVVTDYPRKLAIADTIREKFLAKLHQELPHELGIFVKNIAESKGRWEVCADVLVNRPSQKPIVIGRAAQTIKFARKSAEKELSEMFGVAVSLELWVKVEPNWMKNERLLASMGYMGELV